jgi:hypothetical protein
MQAKIQDNRLIIAIDLIQPPRESASGKTLVVATTGGFEVSDVEQDGSTISVSVNATIPNPNPPKHKSDD